MVRRFILPLAALVLIASGVVSAPLRPATAKRAPASAPAIGFGSAVVVDPVHTFGEPDVKIGLDGVVHSSGPWGTGTQRSIWDVSTDGGHTFHTMHDTAMLSPDQSVSQHAGPGGGDTELAIDRRGRVYYSDLAALVTLKNAMWDPAARKLTTALYLQGRENANGIDRQWFALWDPPDPSATRRASGYTGTFPINYLTFNEAAAGLDCSPPLIGGCSAVAYSKDGSTYGATTATWPIADDGNPVIDQLTGTVIQTISISGGDVGVALLSRGGGGTDPALTKVDEVKIADLPAGTDTSDLFPVTAIDSAGNAYAVWVTHGSGSAMSQAGSWQTFYSSASRASGWKHWSRPVQLSRPPANTNIMPWAVGGSAGRLAVVWYGTADRDHDPSAEDAHQAWDVYLAMVAKANGSHPVVQQTKVTRHPMHYGTICLAGTGCIQQAGNRNLADFFQVDRDPRNGAVVIVYNDTSNELTQNVPPGGPQLAPPVDGAADHRGAEVTMLLRQNRGIGLFGRPVGGPPAIAPSMGDPKGDAVFDPIYGGANVPQLDLTGVTVRRDGGELVIRVGVSSLDDVAQADYATNARAVDWVVRWTGPAADATTGRRNPIYYAAAESNFIGATADGGGAGEVEAPQFFAGTAQSIELCSVSGCDPHIIQYPRPPLSGVAITGRVVLGAGDAPDTLVFHVPLSAVGDPSRGSLLESFSVYTFARNHTAQLPMTNLEAQLGITPVLIDGICCVDVRI